MVNFKTTKHFRDKHNHYVDRSQWHITENVHEPIISRSDFETVQRILENAPVKRPNGDGEIHPLSGLLFCKDCGAKMHIRIDYRNGGKRHVAFCSEYHKGKAKNPKCNSPHIMDADLLMQTIAEVLKKIEDYSISNRAEFEALVKKNLAMQQTDKTKKQQKRIPQITMRLEQIDKVLNKLYEDNALGTIQQDRYEQMSQKYSEEYYALKVELATLQEQLEESGFRNVIMLAVDNITESTNSFGYRYIFTLHPRELLGDAEGLGQEPLDLSSAGNGQLVLLAQLIHTHDGNDIL